MAKFKWDNREFEQIEAPLFAEIVWVEKQTKQDFDDLTGTERKMAILIISLRRAGVMLQWADTASWSITDFEPLDDEDEDPTPTGAEAGSDETSRASEPGGGSGSRKSSTSRRGTSTD